MPTRILFLYNHVAAQGALVIFFFNRKYSSRRVSLYKNELLFATFICSFFIRKCPNQPKLTYIVATDYTKVNIKMNSNVKYLVEWRCGPLSAFPLFVFWNYKHKISLRSNNSPRIG